MSIAANETLAIPADVDRDEMLQRYRAVRRASESLCQPLQTEDYCIQTMAEVSPPKWHLAHVSWFFETFLAKPFLPGYEPYDERFDHLFNSYYQMVGSPYPRAQRGLLSRPTVAEVFAYREHVDRAMQTLIAEVGERHWATVAGRVILGTHHEQQHQELLLMDIKHILGHNPLRPPYRGSPPRPAPTARGAQWLDFAGGLVEIGHAGGEFAYDNESPRHKQWLAPFRLRSQPVTNGDYLAFMEDGGYRRPELWLSDGWSMAGEQCWQAPLYWQQHEGQWWHMTLAGLQRLDRHAPVCHVSYYEADAFATWKGARLPSEAEWEHAAAGHTVIGNMAESGHLQPTAADRDIPAQLFGDVWEWTRSAYSPYPGYRAPAGAIGEYNGKFMSNQMVLRGGCCATPQDHLRATYRNFFYPHDRWAFSGLRLAADAGA